MTNTFVDRVWMEAALEQARLAISRGEVPVGAVLVVGSRAVARAHNRPVSDVDPTAHAEIVTMRRAARVVGNYRTGGTLYVTLEPCLMCMGAMIQARIGRLVFAAPDPKSGAACSLYRIAEDDRLNHRFVVDGGLLAEESAGLLSTFFECRRRSLSVNA